MSESKILEVFNNFSSKVKEIYQEDETICGIIDKAMGLSDEEKISLCHNFYNNFTKIDNAYELLKNKKVKIFSSKEQNTYNLSISLYGEDLPLKRIFNNLEDSTNKNYLWVSLSVLVNYQKPTDTKKTKNSILNVEVDDNVNTMIEDIVDEFKNTMEGSKSDNPMEAILGVTSKITEKYHSQLESGEIRLDGLLSDLTKNMPGLKNMMEKIVPKEQPKPKKEKVIIDENFSTSKVVLGDDKPEENNINLQSMLPMLSGLGGLGGGKGDIENLGKQLLGSDFGDMINEMQQMENIDDPEKLKEMKDKMDNMMKDKFGFDVNQFEKSNVENILNNKD